MKRRNADCGKLRRPLKKSKITEGLYGSTFLYLKFLLVWSLVLIADFILEFRFEYLWPFWLLVRSVYDSFKYQGLAFSVFFVCIAITSDVVCYLYVPVQWLFFAASTYVWVQYVWHTERGICLPTVSLWLLFVYIEASVRLRELKSLPFNLDLCRPFAAHCIGYPVVTLGFGFKSYVSYRIRLRKQKDVQKENEFYVQMLNQALPPELQNSYSEKQKVVSKSEEELVSNGVAGKRPTRTEDDVKRKVADDDDEELDYLEQTMPPKKSNINDTFNDESVDNIVNDQKSLKAVNGIVPKSSNKLNSNKENSSKRGKNYNKDMSVVTFSSSKDDSITRFEIESKKLRTDLQSSRNCEQDLRAQINTMAMNEKSLKSELYQVQQDNENLQTKLHNLVTNRQQDKQNLGILERKLQEERKIRAVVEQQLSQERKAKKAEDAAATRALVIAAAIKNDCSDTCKNRRRDAEIDQKQLRRDLKMKEEQLRILDRELKTLVCQKDTNDTEVLLSALSAMQDKNTHLECSLSSETRIKLDLFSALGEAKRHLEIQLGIVTNKENEIINLQKRIAEVMALVPSNTFNGMTSHTPPPTSASPLYSPKCFVECPTDLLTVSNLNPNAVDYLPKTTA